MTLNKETKPNQSVVNVQAYNIVIREFELKSHVYFRSNTLVKGMKPLIPSVKLYHYYLSTRMI